ncbi:MAG: MarR family winged helix-turn-helix transcriptional regulator [Pseudomonadota bacterium]
MSKPIPVETKSYFDVASPDSADFAIEHYPFFLMNRAAGKYNAALAEALAQVKMDAARWRVLMIVDEREPVSISEIADLAVMKLSTITRSVQRMTADGLVECQTRADDQRVTEARLTKKGQAQLREVKAVAANIFRRAADGMGPDALRRLNDALKRIADNIDRSPYA